MRKIGTIHGNDIIEQDDGSVTFSAGATLDGDGANGQFGEAPCYAPASYDGPTLDVLANAGHPGNWYGVVTDTGDEDGNPIVQKTTDPCPGAYISATTLHLRDEQGNQLPDSSPFKYVDSATVPFIVVPPMIIKGVGPIVLGCRAVVTNSRNGKSTEAVVADVGPRNHLGEISVACARAIGVPTGTTHPANGGGASSPTIQYRLFPGEAAVVNGVTYPLQPS
jgi:Fungal chitosanase of glycosyl hydrolase group 75